MSAAHLPATDSISSSPDPRLGLAGSLRQLVTALCLHGSFIAVTYDLRVPARLGKHSSNLVAEPRLEILRKARNGAVQRQGS